MDNDYPVYPYLDVVQKTVQQPIAFCRITKHNSPAWNGRWVQGQSLTMPALLAVENLMA
jgi:hypothetical protein